MVYPATGSFISASAIRLLSSQLDREFDFVIFAIAEKSFPIENRLPVTLYDSCSTRRNQDILRWMCEAKVRSQVNPNQCGLGFEFDDRSIRTDQRACHPLGLSAHTKTFVFGGTVSVLS